MAVVVGILVASALTLAQARHGEAMTNGLVWGSQKAVEGAQRVVSGVSRALGGRVGHGVPPHLRPQ